MKTICLSILLAFAFLTTPLTTPIASANDRKVVQVFYDFLNNPGSEKHAEAFQRSVTKDWESIGNYSGKNKSQEAFIGQLGGFGKLIPDLSWTVEEMIRSGNRVIVRSRASGTPQGPFFGVDGKGKSFTILAIDIHTLQNGKISKSYHVEDWAGAIAQLR